METPCKYCKFVGCGIYHEKCRKYQEFREERIAISEIRTIANIINYGTRIEHERRKIGGRK